MYVTPEEYLKNHTLITQDLENKLAKAEREINHLCFGRINGKGFDSLSPYQQNLIKEAVCLQAEYTEQYGTYINCPIKSYSAGSTRVAADTSYGNTTQEIINLLEDTGLRCRVL